MKTTGTKMTNKIRYDENNYCHKCKKGITPQENINCHNIIFKHKYLCLMQKDYVSEIFYLCEDCYKTIMEVINTGPKINNL